MKIPVLVLFAPTATGKTALALKLFGKGSLSFFNGKCELISADSMQVYRGFDIGTAKPTLEEQSQLVHHLIDIKNMDEQFTACDFVSSADKLCEDIFNRGYIPLVAGGTGFYIRNFLLGMPETPPSDEKVKESLKRRLEREGVQALYDELLKVDGESASKIDRNDAFRIIRSLEIFLITGKPRSSFEMPSRLREKYDFLILVLEKERKVLYERINLRVEQMFNQGLEQEVRKLVEKGASRQMPAMQAIGYRQWLDYPVWDSETVERIKSDIQHDSRKYAKKQCTFMKNIPGAVYLNADDEDRLFEEVSHKIHEFMANL